MTPERIAALVARWVRFYTRNLPDSVAERRIDEIAADVADQIADERAAGIADVAIARRIASRLVRGLAADVTWRWHQTRLAGRTFESAAVRVALGVAAILTLPLVAGIFTDEVDWSPADFVFAGALLTVIGVALDLAARKAGNLAIAVAIAALGVAVVILGDADDAPGLVLLGLLLLASACALGVRKRPQRG